MTAFQYQTPPAPGRVVRTTTEKQYDDKGRLVKEVTVVEETLPPPVTYQPYQPPRWWTSHGIVPAGPNWTITNTAANGEDPPDQVSAVA